MYIYVHGYIPHTKPNIVAFFMPQHINYKVLVLDWFQECPIYKIWLPWFHL